MRNRLAIAIVALLSWLASTPAAAANYSDIWWNPLEDGWGITIADHETQLFAVWFTYRQDGSPAWFVMPGGTFTQGRRIFTADIYETRGPAYNTTFNANLVSSSKVGSATFDFAPPALAPGWALFSYNVNGLSQTKQIQQQPFGDSTPGWGWDYSDIWWDPTESGWGFTISQHGNTMFGVWYTYDTSGRPTYFILSGGVFTGPNSFTGDFYSTTGPYYGSAYFDATQVHATKVGTATLDFTTAAASLDSSKGYLLGGGRLRNSVNNFTQTKNISRQQFGNRSPTNNTSPTPAKYQLFVAMAGAGSGTVTSNPAGINCGPAANACSASFVNGTYVTLSAAPAGTSKFTGFSGTCSSPNSSCGVSMTAVASVTATFDKLPNASTLTIATLALGPATAGTAYTQPAATANGGSPPYYFQQDTLANGFPPLGMWIDLNGNLTGTPSTSYTQAQQFNFGVCVVDIVGTIKCAQNNVVVNPAKPAANGSMTWQMVDQCNNGMEIDYRFFDRANGMHWPADAGYVYYINNGETRNSNLACVAGAQVCYGAASYDDSIYWGVGLDGTAGCTACCHACDGATHTHTLTCTPNGGGGGTNYYANWSCGSSSQCAAVMGGAHGSTGPFCALADCQRWGNQYIPAGYSCSTTATYTPNPGGSSCSTYP